MWLRPICVARQSEFACYRNAKKLAPPEMFFEPAHLNTSKDFDLVLVPTLVPKLSELMTWKVLLQCCIEVYHWICGINHMGLYDHMPGTCFSSFILMSKSSKLISTFRYTVLKFLPENSLLNATCILLYSLTSCTLILKLYFANWHICGMYCYV